MSAGVPKDDIRNVLVTKARGNSSSGAGTAAKDQQRLPTTVRVDVRIAGNSNTDLATAAEVLLLLSFQVTVDGDFTALPTAVGICRSGSCTGPSSVSNEEAPCSGPALMQFSAARTGRGRREDVFYYTDTATVAGCAKLCLEYKGCAAIQYRSDRERCELSSLSAVQHRLPLIASPHWEHHYREFFCTQTVQGSSAILHTDAPLNDDFGGDVPVSSPPPDMASTVAAEEASVAATTAAAWTVDVSIIERETPNPLGTTNFKGVGNGPPKNALSKSSLVLTITAVLVVVLILAALACGSSKCRPGKPFKRMNKNASTGSFKHWEITNDGKPIGDVDWQQASLADFDDELFWDGNGILALHEGEYHSFGPRPLSIVPSLKGDKGRDAFGEYIETGLDHDENSDGDGSNDNDSSADADPDADDCSGDDDPDDYSAARSTRSNAVGKYDNDYELAHDGNGTGSGDYVLASHHGDGDYELAFSANNDAAVDGRSKGDYPDHGSGNGAGSGDCVLASHHGDGVYELAFDDGVVGDHDQQQQTTDAYELAIGGSPLAKALDKLPLTSDEPYPGMPGSNDGSTTVSTYDNYKHLIGSKREVNPEEQERRKQSLMDSPTNFRLSQADGVLVRAAAAATKAVMGQKSVAQTPCPDIAWSTSPNKVHVQGGGKGRFESV